MVYDDFLADGRAIVLEQLSLGLLDGLLHLIVVHTVVQVVLGLDLFEVLDELDTDGTAIVTNTVKRVDISSLGGNNGLVTAADAQVTVFVHFFLGSRVLGLADHQITVLDHFGHALIVIAQKILILLFFIIIICEVMQHCDDRLTITIKFRNVAMNSFRIKIFTILLFHEF